MIVKMQRVGRLKLKVYKDFLFWVQEEAGKPFEDLFNYVVKYDDENEDFVFYHIEIPTSLLSEVTDIVKEKIDKWVKKYKKEQKEKRVHEWTDEYIWE